MCFMRNYGVLRGAVLCTLLSYSIWSKQKQSGAPIWPLNVGHFVLSPAITMSWILLLSGAKIPPNLLCLGLSTNQHRTETKNEKLLLKQ